MAEPRPATAVPDVPDERALAERLGEIALRERLVLVLDPAELVVREANGAFCRLTGRSHADVLATAGTDLLSTTTDRALSAELAVAASGEPVSLRLRLHTATEFRLLQADLHALPGGAGVLVVADDVTSAERDGALVRGTVAAVDRAQAVIEFDVQGRVLTANRNFLDLMGYSLPEVVGRHHRAFCDAAHAASEEYARFWEQLGAGEYIAGEFKRITKDRREVWLQATYNPVLDVDGSVMKVVKIATDVTAAKVQAAEHVSKVNAIERSQAVIEFTREGRILTANKNFLDVVGYTLPEIVGKHHRIFCDQALAASEEYATFWEHLGAGQYAAGEFERVSKSGRAVWLQATYNPILDSEGAPLKIVKFATDITASKVSTAEVASRMSAVDRSQAVIEFDLEGVVLAANENFLRCMGYSGRELVGQHHSTLCAPEYTRSAEYRDFWMRLGKGEVISGRFHRVGKFGRDVYIQASYNPVLDLKGQVFKVVKYAYDITESVEREHRVASSTADMTVSVRGLVGSTTDIASSSGVATELANETHANAEQGVEALRAALEAIELIQRSSSSISKIVRVMGEIANQTNLLAFNASIEAARAGDHGVGFSIVAGEVRKLAERSSAAAQQIGQLIEESEDRVAQGAQVSKRAEQAFERIVTSVAKTNDAIRTISDRTRAQQESSETVNRLIAQIATQTVD